MDDQSTFQDPLKQAVADDAATNSILNLVSQDSIYLDAYKKYLENALSLEELNKIIIELSLKYKNLK